MLILLVSTSLSGDVFANNSTLLNEKPTESMPVYMGGLFQDIGTLKKGQEQLERGQEQLEKGQEQLEKGQEQILDQIKEIKDDMHTQIKEIKDDMHTLIQFFNKTQQDNERKFEQGYTNLTHAITETRNNITQTQSVNEERFKQLEAHWSAHFYDDVMRNPQFYLGMLTLGLGAKASIALPFVAPYASWLCYATSGISFTQVFWNLLKPTTHEASAINVMGVIGVISGGVIFSVHKNEALLAPHITFNRLVVILGLVASLSSYWKEAYNLALGWIKS